MKKTALIVDDNALNIELVRFLLEAEGWDVRTASDAAQATSSLHEILPDIVLMDLGLPGISGLELTRRLRADPHTAKLPIVAVTASAMKGDEGKALEAGCNGYIAKPIDTRSFVKQIDDVLNSAR
jgi:CheY-like chemotaxis protein